MHLPDPDTLFRLVPSDPRICLGPMMLFSLRYLLFLLLPWGTGCHNPARQNVAEVQIGVHEAEWRKELVPGRRAERALGYLLTQDFDVRVTRDEHARVERILATQREILRDASGAGRKWQIDLAIKEDLVQSVKFTPLGP